MKSIGQFIQSGEWKGEKHVPVIHCPEKVNSNTLFALKVQVGEAIPHPNTFEHYISWIKIFFLAEGKKMPVLISEMDFSAHGEGEVTTHPILNASITLPASGTLFALSYCNLHGLWENSFDITVI